MLETLENATTRARWWLAAPVALGGIAILALVAWQLTGTAGTRPLALWFLAMCGLAALPLAAALAAARPVLGLLLAVFVTGGAAQLYVTEPLWYPALYLPPRSSAEMAMFALVAGQGAFSFLCLVTTLRRGAIGAVLGAFGASRWAILLVLSALFTVSILNYLRLDDLAGYAVQIAAGAGLIAINLVTLVAIIRFLPATAGLPRLLLSPWVLAAISGLASVLLCWTAFERMAHVTDEIVYMIQARIFAGGALWAPALPEAAQPAFAFFQLDFQGDRWVSVLAPGWPAVLAIGECLGVPWLVNPLLGAGSVLLCHDLLRRFFDLPTARIGTLLLAFSPWHMAMGASLMTHSLTLFLVLVAACCLVRVRSASGGARSGLALAAGLAMGWVFLARPLDGIAAGGTFGLILLLSGRFDRIVPQVLAYGVGCALTGGLVFLYNAQISGDPLLAPMAAYFDQTWELEGFANRLGFGAEIGPPGGFGHMELWTPGHSPLEAGINTLNNINALHIDLFGWGAGSLIFVWALVLCGQRSRRNAAMWLALAIVVLIYALYWFAGSFYVGARYWYLAILPLVGLSVRGIWVVAERLEMHGFPNIGARLSGAVVILATFGLIVFGSYRGVTRYYEHRGYHDGFRDIAIAIPEDGPAPLYLVTPSRQMGAAFFLNDPWMRPANPIFAEDLGPDSNAAVIAAFPDRPVIYLREAAQN